jgi:sugar lactone lactonase YvrE
MKIIPSRRQMPLPTPFVSPQRWAVVCIVLLCLLSAVDLFAQASVTLLGGGPTNSTGNPASSAGYIDGPTASTALFHRPSGIALDSANANLYVADYSNNAVRMLALSAGETSTFATNKINRPIGVVLDGANNVYVLNSGTGTVLMFNQFGQLIRTNASGLGTPTAIAIDGLTNLYVTVGNTVKCITPAGVITNAATISLAGTSLDGVAVLDSGLLAVTDAGNNGIWLVNPTIHTYWQFTGFHGAADVDGTAASAAFDGPCGIAKAGNGILVVTDYTNNQVRYVGPDGTVTNLYGIPTADWCSGEHYAGFNDAYLTVSACPVPPYSCSCAEAHWPFGVAVASDGSVYTTEVYWNIIRHTTSTDLTGPGPAGFPPIFNGPEGIALDSQLDVMYIADWTSNIIQVLDLSNTATNVNHMNTFLNAANGISQPVDVAIDSNEYLYVLNRGTNGNGSILQFWYWPWPDVIDTIATGLANPTALAIDGDGNIFVAEQTGAVQVFVPGVYSNTIVTITNAGVQLQGIAMFDDGTIAVSDAGNDVVWQINPITKVYSRLTGQLGVPGNQQGPTNTVVKLNQPHKLTRAGANQLVLADYGNNQLLVLERSGAITNRSILNSSNSIIWFGKLGDPVQTNQLTKWVPMMAPIGVAVGPGGAVYSSELSTNNCIREFIVANLLPPGTPPYDALPYFHEPMGVALDDAFVNLYIADQADNAVQVLDLINNQTSVFVDTNNSSLISQPVAVAVDAFDDIFVLSQGTGGNGSILEFDQFGNLLATNATGLALPTAMTLDYGGNLFVAEQGGVVQEIVGGVSTNVVVLATVTNANVSLQGIALLDNGFIAVSDAGNDVIWQINLSTTYVSVLTGQIGRPGNTEGSSAFAKLNNPRQMSGAAGNQLVLADYGNNRIVVVNSYGAVTNVLNPTNSLIWFGVPGDPVNTNSVRWVPMVAPVGVAVGNGLVYSSETFYDDIRQINGPGLAPPPVPAPVPAPQIGWVQFVLNSQNDWVTQLNPGTSFTFNNDVVIAILGTPGTETLYSYIATTNLANIKNPAQEYTAEPYQNGLLSTDTEWHNVVGYPILPGTVDKSDVTIEAIGVEPGSPSSPIVQARFQFITANPLISGANAAQFTVTDFTTNAYMLYTTDGSFPDPTNASSTTVLTNYVQLSINANTNVPFSIRAFCTNYQPSEVISTVFLTNAYVPNSIAFGFASGEASSQFICSPGQTFYAPITLNVLSGTLMYTLQFNVTVTNLGSSPPPVLITPALTNNVGFDSMLEYPNPSEPDEYITIPTAMFLEDIVTNNPQLPNPPPGYALLNTTNYLAPNYWPWYTFGYFANLQFIDTNVNLLGVGWQETHFIYGTNLYPTPNQDLIAYSRAHDDLFLQANGKVIAGGYRFLVPFAATPGQMYQIQIGRPSATSDGIGAPGSSVYIATPTNGSLYAGAINSLKNVTVGQISYIAGNCYPFRWFNAGDFGNTNLQDADVQQVFNSAVYGYNEPMNSDFFDSMDSCCGFGITNTGAGYLTNNTSITTQAMEDLLFDGDDTTINQIAFGDGQLDVCDVFVTFRRSLDPSLVWYSRFWTNNATSAFRGANIVSNIYNSAAVTTMGSSGGGKAKPAISSSSVTNQPKVNFTAGDVTNATANQKVSIPIMAQVFGNYPLRVLMLNLSVEPLDGSPLLTTPVSFTVNDAVLGAPYTTASTGNGNFAAVWLDNTIDGLTGNATIGWLTVTIPTNATSLSSYAIHFDHASGSPSGLRSFPRQTLTGLITLSSRSSSTYNDGIPDLWRLRYFGTTNNLLSVATADADGDGMNNWQEYIAGTDPTDPTSCLTAGTDQAAAQQSQDCVISWPSVAGKTYTIERSTTIFAPNWTTISTVTGTGSFMEIHDTSGTSPRFYRVQVQ